MSGGVSASTLATLSLGAQGAGTLASAYGAYTKSKDDKSYLEYQSAVSKNNQQYATWQSDDALLRGQTERNRHQLKVAALKSTQRASLAARGIDVGEGSALDILSDTDLLGAVDANVIADNSEKEAWGFRVQAANHGANAGLLSMRARNESPWGAAAGSLLTGAGSVAKSWYAMRETGMFSSPVQEARPGQYSTVNRQYG